MALTSLTSILALLLFQAGCEQSEAARREAAAENLMKVADAVEAYDAKLNAESSDDQDSSSSTQDSTDSVKTPTLEGPAGGDSEADSGTESDRTETEPAEPTIEIRENWIRLSKGHEVWIDKKAKHVMFAGHVCLNDGQLEMFVCPQGTKEHESVIASSVLSSQIHHALLLVGCTPGKASSWDPVYRPAYGPTIDATIKWRDAKSGKTKSQDAKQWIRDVDTNKAMTQRWIFGGSGFWKDPDTGKEIYFGDSGELICLSNFSTATIDVDVKSSQANDGLLFEAFTENIPPVGTKVYTILMPGEIVKPEVKEAENEAAKTNETETKLEEAETVQDDKTARPSDKEIEIEVDQ